VTALAAAILVVAVAAAPAGAQTVRGELGGGPALSGGRVAWGEEARSGGVRVVMGRERRVLHRLAAPTAARTTRGFMGVPAIFGASATTWAALAYTATSRQDSSDSASTTLSPVALGGPVGAAPAVLGGCVVARGDDQCGPGVCSSPYGVAVDGERIAVAHSGAPCDRPDALGAWIVVHGPGAPVVVPAAGEVRDVALAGRYLAWTEWGEVSRLVVHDLAAGAAALTVPADAVRARQLDELALQPDGTVAFTFWNRHSGRGATLAWAAPGRPGVRRLDRHVGSYVELALDAGRVLYERVVSERRFTGELVLRPLEGGGGRRLAFFPERRRRLGNVDLEGDRAAWAVQPTRRGYDPLPTGPARIVVRTL
jgi:hypothetical protein